MASHPQPVIIVTGAAGGIGAATVAELLDRGARVLASDSSDGVLDAWSSKAMAMVVDVSSNAEVEGLVATALRTYGRLDGLFNNAGILGASSPVESYPEEVLTQVLDVNVRGVFLGMRAAIPAIKASGGGSIVNNASTGGMVGAANQAPYVASKHAVVGLTRSVALEVAPYAIAVNALAPGPTDTQMMREVVAGWNAAGQDPAGSLLRVTPMGRMASAEEIANVAAWLLMEAPPYLTGAVIPVDGAQTAQ